MIALVTGALGQLGRALIATAPAGVETHATDIGELDICDPAAVQAHVAALRPSVIVNAAAYTAVDKAETDGEGARRLNVDAVANLSRAAAACGARLVHISTDFVFDGKSGTPYPPDALAAPLSVYGQTKLDGERVAGPDALILRTSWVHAARGNNFVLTMLRLMAERDEVRVVADQIGTPSFATGVAETIWGLVAGGHSGVYHHTDSGVASWYDFAVAIQEEALALGLLDRAVPVVPIATTQYPTPARRPPFSVLDKSRTIAALGIVPPHWRVNLRRMLTEMRMHG